MEGGGVIGCGCGFFDNDESTYTPPTRFSRLDTVRRRRCCSCQEMINIGDECVEFKRYRDARNDTEERFHGSEVHLAPWFMCESCGEMYLNLAWYGHCIPLPDDMRQLMREHRILTGFGPRKE